VGSVTTLSNLVRMLYSLAGVYPSGRPMLYAENFSPNRVEGACLVCHGLGRIYDVTEESMVPDDSLTIRKRAVAAWPTAWQNAGDGGARCFYLCEELGNSMAQRRSKADASPRSKTRAALENAT
jgi:excinuclease UvrABC ATPase subunit